MIYRYENKKKKLLKNFNEASNVFKVRSGSECIFVQYETMSALKLYESRDEAEYAYKNQKAAFNDDIGPAAFGGVCKYHISKSFYKRHITNIPYIEYPILGTMYGFYTEVVFTYCKRDAEYENHSKYFPSAKEYKSIIKELQKKFSKTKRKLYGIPAKEISNYDYDLDMRNIGWRADGSIVIIDFGCVSLEM